MGYNQNDDKLLKFFELEQEKGNLQLSIFSYKEGNPKLQIIRTYNKKDGTVGYTQSGRLSKKEFQFLLDKSKDILNEMEKVTGGG